MAITIDISTGIDGLWIIQDNGNPTDGMSEVRDPNGAGIQTFAHPADLVTILSRSGQSLTVNLVEALVSFTVGSLTSTTVRPDLVLVNQLSTAGVVTLTANQTITESGGDAATDITASQLLLDAGTGIGTSGNPIETQVFILEGEAASGGIFLSNIAIELLIGSGDLRGLFTGTSGDISLTNQGSISLIDGDDPQTITSAGAITLTAIDDIVLEGFRPGVMERLGLGPDAMLARNPALVFGRMTGWGQDGPLAHVAGHDINYIAVTGALAAIGPRGAPSSPPLNLVGDYGGGALDLAMGVLAAGRSGRGPRCQSPRPAAAHWAARSSTWTATGRSRWSRSTTSPTL